jgi:hypothetical protein
MTDLQTVVLKTSSKTRLKFLKREYEESLMNTKPNTERSSYICDLLDAIDEELEKRG